MASKFAVESETSSITVYDLKVNTTGGDFKKYVSNNLNGSIFMEKTPIKIEKGHILIGIDGQDYRQSSPKDIQSKLKRGVLNHMFTLTIAIPSGPYFSQVSTSKWVSS